ncbi:SycD/LcrH family type III secretion system chaperone (plasmid) [Bradyrhizobium sp. Pa8]|uniref:SycD/LcrH family type III secretion system chaperone n=1 Tax=Bradyrhizobium sp. Pa8 TaxID=3386552 RepID=UPI00403F351B
MTMAEGGILNVGDAVEAGRLVQFAIDFAAGRADLAAFIGITDDELEAMYVYGHRYYSCGKYEEALNFFRFLCLHRHVEARFWLGLAAASEMLGNTENAVHAYRLAALLNREDLEIPLRTAKCFIKLEQPAEAIKALEDALSLSIGKPEHRALARRARMMLGRLKAEAEFNNA